LRNVSFTLPPSSLVVIVGANGSGKSSLVNLLTCIYPPSTGHILFDGTEPYEYSEGDKGNEKDREREKSACVRRRVEDLQRQTAVLTQHCTLFSAFPVWENIAIGDPEFCLSASADAPSVSPFSSQQTDRLKPNNDLQIDLRARVREAARLGGALGFIDRLERGFDDVLRPVWTAYGSAWPMPDGPLKDTMDKLEQWKDLSGGEEQRLAAYVPLSLYTFLPFGWQVVSDGHLS
jgi:ABC-type multidrug transport system fused ATPase/permease subunit